MNRRSVSEEFIAEQTEAGKAKDFLLNNIAAVV